MADAAVKHRKIASKVYVPKYSAIVMDADTGAILEQEDAHGSRHPASLTKMATLYMAFEALQSGRLTLQTKMTTSLKASRQIPSKLGLVPGEQITVYQAIMGLVTKSANDAAVVLAEHLAGTEEAFAQQMTQKARRLGMTKTIFKNASGVPNSAQVTSAYDMAILSRALYRDFPQQYKYFKNQTFTHKGMVHRNHNHLLGKVEGLDGIKTGFIAAAGFNLAASAVRYDAAQRPHRLITVVLGGANRHWRDRRVTDLLETNFRKMGLSDSNAVSPAASPSPKITQLVMQDLASKAPTLEGKTAVATHQSEMVDTSVALDQLLDTVVRQDASAISRGPDPKPVAWVVPTASTGEALTGKKKKEKGKYTAQVGTYRSKQTARRYAQQAKVLLGAGQVQTVRINKGKKKLVAARVAALSESQAKNLCHKLQKKGQQCMVY